MPEGDTIFRTAATLRPAMQGGVIERATVRDRQFDADVLVGRSVASIEARGKHLLMHLNRGRGIPNGPPPSKGEARGGIEDESRVESRESRAEEVFSGPRLSALDSRLSSRNPSPNLSPEGRGIFTLHSHMGMTGSWHIYRPGDAWRKPAHYAALVLAINELEVICFSPKLLELLSADQLRRHPHLTRLGPDVLAAEFDMPVALARFRARADLPIGEAVMNQTIVCGIGNIYKSEVLFLLGFDPLAPVERFTDDELVRLLQKARGLMQRNCDGHRRTTRFGSDAGRLWVYGRSGKPCPKCGAVIQLQRQGDAGRTTCWCPRCQPSRTGAAL